ncbi:MAG: DNA ligase [Rubrivivax sp.]|nr:DNA ligase [Rubrivivax sp.]
MRYPSGVNRREALAWVAGLAGVGGLPAAYAGLPQPLMLARVAAPDVDPEGYLVSEKLDGVRGIWDGHKLCFRSGASIAAPAWFLAQLPVTPLDGELWQGRGQFDAVSSTVRRAQPDDARWRQLHYAVFDLPGSAETFAVRAERLHALVLAAPGSPLFWVEQRSEPSRAALRRRLAEVVQADGEGLMLHRADALYAAGRSDALLKLKPLEDDEAQVLAHLPGQGRHLGRLGALRVRDAAGREFQLGSGFSDAQREAPPPLGSWVTYTFLGRTRTGLPRFASFLRRRDEP